jgi:hypothetical protein
VGILHELFPERRAFAARAQQDDRLRRIGVLMSGDENDPVIIPLVKGGRNDRSNLQVLCVPATYENPPAIP